MAVPVEKRTTPELQYVTTMRKIAQMTFELTERYDSKAWSRMGRYMCEDASLALRNALLIDAIYLYTEADLQRERELIQGAYGYLAHLEAMLDLSIRYFDRANKEIKAKQEAEFARVEAEAGCRPRRLKRKGPTENQLVDVASHISKERDLLHGINRKAPELLEKYLGRKQGTTRAED